MMLLINVVKALKHSLSEEHIASGLKKCRNAGKKELNEEDVSSLFSVNCVFIGDTDILTSPRKTTLLFTAKPPPPAVDGFVVEEEEEREEEPHTSLFRECGFFDSTALLYDQLDSLPPQQQARAPSRPSSSSAAAPPPTTAVAPPSQPPAAVPAAAVKAIASRGEITIDEQLVYPRRSEIKELVRLSESLAVYNEKITGKISEMKKRLTILMESTDSHQPPKKKRAKVDKK